MNGIAKSTVGTARNYADWSAVMGIFRIGGVFKDIQDYADYSHNRLYYHGKLIGKVITDNWQFRKIRNDIENGAFLKAELNPEYRYYNVTATLCSKEFPDRIPFHLNIIARNIIEAKCKAVLQIIQKYNLTTDNYDIETEVEIFLANELSSKAKSIEGTND